jgi:hypothetical protein
MHRPACSRSELESGHRAIAQSDRVAPRLLHEAGPPKRGARESETMKRVASITVAFAAVLSIRSALADQWTVAKGKVYKGPEGEKVEIVPVEPVSDNKVLVRFSGTGSELDDVVLLHEVHEWGKNADVKTMLHGRSYVTITARSGWWSSKSYELYHPKNRDGVHIAFDEKETKALDGNKVLERFQELKSSGALDKIQAFNRAKEMEAQDKYLAKEVDATNKACASSIAMSIEWQGVTDEMIKEISIHGYCSAVLEAARGICSDETAKKAVNQKMKQIVCAFGPKLGLSKDGSKVVFTTAKDAPNQADFARSWLMQKL